VIARAYSGAADLASICQEPDRNFTRGSDAKLLDGMYSEILTALREVMRLSGLDADEIERRMAAMDKRHQAVEP
jgi:hypothetical protein